MVAPTRERLAPKTMGLFEKVGIICEEMRDKSSRELVFVNGELGIWFFLAEVNNVPTHVEYGAADIGISDRDMVLEEERKFYEVLDLNFGGYRMCVCGPEPAGELLRHYEMIRVATKYPGTARDYFYDKKYQAMEIVKLSGSTELTSIVGLSGMIVDIVEIGSALRGNGLTMLEEVCDLSARVIVNQMNMKRENKRIIKLIHDLREVLTGKDVDR